jgi:hypothetical protein
MPRTSLIAIVVALLSLAAWALVWGFLWCFVIMTSWWLSVVEALLTALAAGVAFYLVVYGFMLPG